MKKILIPIVVTAIVLFWFVIYIVMFMTQLPLFWGLAFAMIPLILCVIMVWVCIERIKEIQGGEDDDISQY